MTVNEFRDNIVEKMKEMGIDEEFMEHPAFSSVLAEISVLIGQMNMFEAGNNVSMSKQEQGLSFSWENSSNKRYDVQISVPDKDTIKAVRTEEESRLIGDKLADEKKILEIDSKYTPYGEVVIDEYYVGADNYTTGLDGSIISTTATSKKYDNNGVMVERENVSKKPHKAMESVRNIKPSVVLNDMSKGDMLRVDSSCRRRELLVRDKLDTATIRYEDNDKNEKYEGIIPLNQEYGLRDMRILGQQLEQDRVVIHPIFKEEIEEMIMKEKNPRIQEGLRAYAKGRETYSYDSSMDKDFVSLMQK